MSPLTPDERALMYECSDLLGERLAGPLRELADKLEAEPDDHDLCTITGDVWAAEAESRERAERERGEAWAELAAARGEADMWHKIADRHLDEHDEARSALSEAQRENAVNLERALKAENQRDEARETLEAFVDAFTRDIGKVLAPLPSAERHRIVYDCMRSTYSALARAEEAMDGVERTHTLVPVEMCRRASALYRVTAHQHPVGSVDRELATAHAEAFETAGRGEPVGEWPT